MCYDISFKSKVGDLTDYFPDLTFDKQINIDFGPEAHIAGHMYENHPILYRNADFKVEAKDMHWSVVPSHIENLKQFLPFRSGYLNAKSEKVLDDTKSYWYKIKHNRCLIPVTAFYEHRVVSNFKSKIPYHLRLNEQKMFFIPALYATNYNITADDDGYWSFSLFTRPAIDNWLMRQIHNANADGGKFRMPLLLPYELSELFLAPDLSLDDYRSIINYEMPAEALSYYTVWSLRSKKPRPDGLPKDAPFNWGLAQITKESAATQGELF